MLEIKIGDEVFIKIDEDEYDESDMFDAALDHMPRPSHVTWTVKKITSSACVIEFEGTQSFHRLFVRACHLKKLYNEMPGDTTKEFETLQKALGELAYDPSFRPRPAMLQRISAGYYTNTPARIWGNVGAERMTSDASNAWSEYCDDIKSRAMDCFYSDLIWVFNIKRGGTNNLWMQCITAAKKNASKALTWSMEYDYCWWALYNEFEKAYEELKK